MINLLAFLTKDFDVKEREWFFGYLKFFEILLIIATCVAIPCVVLEYRISAKEILGIIIGLAGYLVSAAIFACSIKKF